MQNETTNHHSQLICRRCGQPVVVNASRYDVFEQMHWLCFHLEFEHQSDPDEECGDPSCPLWKIQVFRQALVAFGQDPDAIMGEAIKERWNL